MWFRPCSYFNKIFRQFDYVKNIEKVFRQPFSVAEVTDNRETLLIV